MTNTRLTMSSIFKTSNNLIVRMKKEISHLFFRFAVSSISIMGRCFDFFYYKSSLSLVAKNTNYQKKYSLLRERASVLRTVEHHGWFVLRYSDVKKMFRDERLSSNVFGNKQYRKICKLAIGTDEIPFLNYPWIQQLDPPDHTRSRKLANRGFSNKFISSLNILIEDLAEEMLSEIESGQKFELIEKFAGPFPALIIANILGVPPEDRGYFVDASNRLTNVSKIADLSSFGVALKADSELRTYINGLVEEKRRTPQEDDLLSQLIMIENEEDGISTDELISLAVFLLLAGHETNTRMITSAIFLFLTHQDQKSIAMNSRVAMLKALDEVLRLEPPVLIAPRRATCDFKVENKKIKEGQIVCLCVASANRDPREFDNPDSFNVTRESSLHLSFGYGIHMCVGIALAKLAGSIAIEKFFNRFSKLEILNEKIEWGDDPTFRGIQSLWLVDNPKNE